MAVLVPPPVITSASRKTKDNTPLVQGTSQPNASIEVFANGVSVGTTTASPGGAWSLSTTTLADGAYAITARQTVGPNTSIDSAPITVTVDTVPPQPPPRVWVIEQDGALLVEWDPSPSPDVWGYHVYRKLDTEPETAYVKITVSGPVAAASRCYRDTGLANGTKYNYKVSAVDDAESQ